MRKKQLAGLEWFEHDQVQLQGIRYGFLTRRGGFSAGVYQSLNFGGADHPELIQKNYHKVVTTLGNQTTTLHQVHQVHGKECIWIEAGPEGRFSPISPNKKRADALITRVPNQLLVIKTADCVPVIVMAPEIPLVAIIHAGWRGINLGIIAATVTQMRQKTTASLKAVIGPCIQADSYEVDLPIYQAFETLDPPIKDQVFRPKETTPSKFTLDLPGLCRYQLQCMNVDQVETLALDTYTQESLFFSCRRAGHQHLGNQFGRQLSFVMIGD